MSDVAALSDQVRNTVEAIKQPALAPTVEDGGIASTTLEVATTYLHEVLRPALHLFSQLDEDERRGLADGLQELTSHLFAAALAHRGTELATALLDTTLKVVPPSQLRHDLAAATREPTLFATLVRARWLLRHGEGKRGLREGEVVLQHSKEPALLAAARALVDVPEPIGSAPMLRTINGVGTALYGRDDVAPDGTYTATQYFVLLFVPVFPISRYIVSSAPNGGWYFHARRRLSRWQQRYRRALGVGVLAAVLANAVPDLSAAIGWQARSALREARALEAANHADDARRAYAKVLETWPEAPDAVLQPALERWLALQPASGCGSDDTAVTKVVRQVSTYPSAARSPAALAALDERVTECARALVVEGGERPRRLAQRRLYALADAVTHHFAGPLRDSQLAIARSWASEGWPLQAALAALEDDSPEATELAAAQLEALGDVGTLYVEERAAIERFIARGAPGAELARTRLKAAVELEAANGRQALLESGDLEALAAQLARTPGDQQLATAVAAQHAAANRLEQAQAVLEGLGPLAARTVSNQYLDIVLRRASGHRQEADEALERFLDRTAPRYLAATADLEAAAREAQDKVISELQADRMPDDLRTKLIAAKTDRATQNGLVRDYVATQLRSNLTLIKKRDHLDRLAAVVEASTSWGAVLLGRAAKVEGAKRQALLAEAERVFLSVRGDAEGTPAFKLGYGQVLHRLGRPTEGDAQLQALAASSGPEVKLAVANVYRELGLTAQFRQLCEAVVDGHSEFADDAVRFLMVSADTLDEKEKWLGRLSNRLPVDLANARSVSGERLLQQGKYKEAAAAFQQSAAFFKKDAALHPVSANNAAVALQQAITASFDPTVWAEVLRLQRSALSGSPDDTVAISNTLNTLSNNAKLQVVEALTRVKVSELGLTEAAIVFDALAAGPRRAEVRAAFTQNPDGKRALELFEQHHTLAPQAAAMWQSHLQLLLTMGDAVGSAALAHRAARAGITSAESAPRTPEARQRAAEALDHWLARTAAQKGNRQRLELMLCALGASGRLDVERTTQLVTHCRALAGSKDLDARPLLAWALSRQALATASAASPALKQAFDDQPERSPLFQAWARARTDTGLRKALAADPSLKEAAAILRDVGEPSHWHWVVADLADDQLARMHVLTATDVHRAAIARYFGRITHDPDAQLEAQVSEAMFPVLPAELKPDWVP